MNKYFNSYRKMISLRGLTDHTIKSYSTYILAYFDFLTDVIHKSPEDVTWDEMRQFVRWLQDTRSLSDRTMNAVISQLRFFTIYVLHKPWDATQLPFRKFDNYLPYVPSQQEVKTFISTIPDLKQKAMVSLMYSSGLRIGEVCHLKYQDIERRNMRIHISHGKNRSDRYALLSKTALEIFHNTGLLMISLWTGFSQNNVINRSRLILFIFPGISTNTKDGLDGLNVLPAIPSAMLLALTFMKMVQTF